MISQNKVDPQLFYSDLQNFLNVFIRMISPDLNLKNCIDKILLPGRYAEIFPHNHLIIIIQPSGETADTTAV